MLAPNLAPSQLVSHANVRMTVYRILPGSLDERDSRPGQPGMLRMDIPYLNPGHYRTPGGPSACSETSSNVSGSTAGGAKRHPARPVPVSPTFPTHDVGTATMSGQGGESYELSALRRYLASDAHARVLPLYD